MFHQSSIQSELADGASESNFSRFFLAGQSCFEQSDMDNAFANYIGALQYWSPVLPNNILIDKIISNLLVIVENGLEKDSAITRIQFVIDTLQEFSSDDFMTKERKIWFARAYFLKSVVYARLSIAKLPSDSAYRDASDNRVEESESIEAFAEGCSLNKAQGIDILLHLNQLKEKYLAAGDVELSYEVYRDFYQKIQSYTEISATPDSPIYLNVENRIANASDAEILAILNELAGGSVLQNEDYGHLANRIDDLYVQATINSCNKKIRENKLLEAMDDCSYFKEIFPHHVKILDDAFIQTVMDECNKKIKANKPQEAIDNCQYIKSRNEFGSYINMINPVIFRARAQQTVSTKFKNDIELAKQYIARAEVYSTKPPLDFEKAIRCHKAAYDLLSKLSKENKNLEDNSIEEERANQIKKLYDDNTNKKVALIGIIDALKVKQINREEIDESIKHFFLMEKAIFSFSLSDLDPDKKATITVLSKDVADATRRESFANILDQLQNGKLIAFDDVAHVQSIVDKIFIAEIVSYLEKNSKSNPGTVIATCKSILKKYPNEKIEEILSRVKKEVDAASRLEEGEYKVENKKIQKIKRKKHKQKEVAEYNEKQAEKQRQDMLRQALKDGKKVQAIASSAVKVIVSKTLQEIEAREQAVVVSTIDGILQTLEAQEKATQAIASSAVQTIVSKTMQEIDAREQAVVVSTVEGMLQTIDATEAAEAKAIQAEILKKKLAPISTIDYSEDVKKVISLIKGEDPDHLTLLVGGHPREKMLEKHFPEVEIVKKHLIDYDIITQSSHEEIKKAFESDPRLEKKESRKDSRDGRITIDTYLFTDGVRIEIKALPYGKPITIVTYTNQKNQSISMEVFRREELASHKYSSNAEALQKIDFLKRDSKDNFYVDEHGNVYYVLPSEDWKAALTQRDAIELPVEDKEIITAFLSDPILMLRVIHYTAERKYQKISDKIKNAISFSLNVLKNPKKKDLSGINAWLDNLFCDGDSVRKFELLCDTGIFGALFPELDEIIKKDKAIKDWIIKELPKIKKVLSGDLNQVYMLFVVAILKKTLLSGKDESEDMMNIIERNPLIKKSFERFIGFGILASLNDAKQKWRETSFALQVAVLEQKQQPQLQQKVLRQNFRRPSTLFTGPPLQTNSPGLMSPPSLAGVSPSSSNFSLSSSSAVNASSPYHGINGAQSRSRLTPSPVSISPSMRCSSFSNNYSPNSNPTMSPIPASIGGVNAMAPSYGSAISCSIVPNSGITLSSFRQATPSPINAIQPSSYNLLLSPASVGHILTPASVPAPVFYQSSPSHTVLNHSSSYGQLDLQQQQRSVVNAPAPGNQPPMNYAGNQARSFFPNTSSHHLLHRDESSRYGEKQQAQRPLYATGTSRYKPFQ